MNEHRTNKPPTTGGKAKATNVLSDSGYSRERADEANDRVQRRAYPNIRLRSAYSSIVGNIPALRPGDVQAAAAILGRIRLAIAQGGWTRNEWRRLRTLEAKWAERASGRDRRFNLVGNRATGLTREQLTQVKREGVMNEVADLISGGRGK